MARIGDLPVLLVLASVWCCDILVQSLPQYRQRIPNGVNVPGVMSVGHVRTQGGGPLNSFGTAFQQANYQWTKQLCELDSDGDGFTNGEELGDPCCIWTSSTGNAILRVQGLSNPGDPLSASNLHDRSNCPAAGQGELSNNMTKPTGGAAINDDKSFDSSASFAIEPQVIHMPSAKDFDSSRSSPSDQETPKPQVTQEPKTKSAATFAIANAVVTCASLVVVMALIG